MSTERFVILGKDPVVVERPIDDFSAPEGSWHNQINYEKRFRNLPNHITDLELAVEKLQAKSADDARTKWRVFRWGWWK